MRLVELTSSTGLPLWVNLAHVALVRHAPGDQTAVYFAVADENGCLVSEWVRETPAEVVRRIEAAGLVEVGA